MTLPPPFLRFLLLGSALLAGPLAAAEPAPAVIPLAGTWKFRLDAEDQGIKEKWFTRQLADTVKLPGTTDENQKGIRKDEQALDRMSRVWYWKGPAWYQREITIPESWAGKHITLTLERSKNTRVWVNDIFCGREDTLSALQIFDVTKAIKPGTQTLTILVDNAKLPPVGPAHAIDERTQTNWNGIIGRIELQATDPVWIEDVQVYPDAVKKLAKVRVVVGNITGKPAAGKLTIGARSENVSSPVDFARQNVEVAAPNRENVIEFDYSPGGDVPLWSEHQPALVRLDLNLETKAGDQACADRKSARFGMRNFTREGNLLKNNGQTVFLRGRLDCANYPLTGYAPMDKASWVRLLTLQKDWGLNHIRFHSWCPPAAAFEAADEIGFYFQAELPNKRSAFNAPENKDAAHWNIDYTTVDSTETNVPLYDYGKREGDLILKHFGNQASFAMFTLGNELGRTQGMFDLVAHFKKSDPRRLHAQGSNNMHWQPSLAEGDDFWVTGKVEKSSRPLRGSFAGPDFPNAHINNFPPSTMVDFTASIAGVPVPLIGHETGQFQVSPDYRDIPKFTGVLRARHYEVFRERIKKAGMLDQAHDFVMASGALAAICYREDIETALRTPGMGGFQLLDIQDFPGQGTALVGMLNVFMESKGIIPPEKWRQFCSPTVPLLRMKKYAWTMDETFHGKVQVAHYGPATLPNAVLKATLTGEHLSKPIEFAFPPLTLAPGGLIDIGEYVLDFGNLNVKTPQRLDLTLGIEGTTHQNSYPLWIYPPKVDNTTPAGVLIAESYADAKTRAHLVSGGKVLLLPRHDKLPHSVQGGFQTEFWSPMFAESAIKRGETPPPGTLGFICDPKHPALAHFPTEFHSNWQWWHLVKNSRPIAYDGSPDDYRPIVQAIDNFVRNHKLGMLAETKVGKGSMLICAVNLLDHQDRPEARQFLHSLLRYLESPAFAPKSALAPELLEKLFPQ